jgi:hypothetical protein
MNEVHDSDIGEDIGRLIGFALNPRSRPAQEPVYDELLRRFRMDATFRSLTTAVLRGLGLSILDTGEHGMVLGASQESIFALRLSDYRQNLSLEDRICHGMIQLAIAAWCFPTAASLADPDPVVFQLTTHRVVRYLVDLCQQLKLRADRDPDLGTLELREAWRVILERAETRSTPDGRRVAQTLSGMVAYALTHLERGGLLRRVSEEEGGTFKTFSSYRVQVRELGAHDAFQLVQEARRRLEAVPTDQPAGEES